MTASSLSIRRFSGQALNDYIETVARLRIEVFRDFPYLYDGNMEYELKYLQTYIRCPQAVVVVAFAGTEVVGASTAIPLQFEEAAFQQSFIDQGYDPARLFREHRRMQRVKVSALSARHRSRCVRFSSE